MHLTAESNSYRQLYKVSEGWHEEAKKSKQLPAPPGKPPPSLPKAVSTGNPTVVTKTEETTSSSSASHAVEARVPPPTIDNVPTTTLERNLEGPSKRTKLEPQAEQTPLPQSDVRSQPIPEDKTVPSAVPSVIMQQTAVDMVADLGQQLGLVSSTAQPVTPVQSTSPATPKAPPPTAPSPHSGSLPEAHSSYQSSQASTTVSQQIREMWPSPAPASPWTPVEQTPFTPPATQVSQAPLTATQPFPSVQPKQATPAPAAPSSAADSSDARAISALFLLLHKLIPHLQQDLILGRCSPCRTSTKRLYTPNELDAGTEPNFQAV